MGWTAELVNARNKRMGTEPLVIEPEKPKKKRRGVMNKNEILYSEYLELRKLCGEIMFWHFEFHAFPLAKGAKFTPDFDVCEADGSRMLVDVKAYWKNQKRVHVEAAAMVRIKVAAEKYPQYKWAHAWRDERGEWVHKFIGVAK